MNIVILAAGMGKRMQSALPKVLHPLAGKPLLGHVIDTARHLSPSCLCVIYGHGGDAVPVACNAADITFTKQEPQLGTGHAVMQAVPVLNDQVPTLILYGDVPLTSTATLQRLVAAAGKDKLGILTIHLDNPTGYGRIVREHGQIRRIVEQKDATPDELAITEINTGIIVAPTKQLKQWLNKLSNDNVQKEYYLTDIVAHAAAEGVDIVSAQPALAVETLGVNSKVQLAELERAYQQQIARQLLEQGVTLADPARLDVRGNLTCGRDVSIDVNCVFEGQVSLADGVTIGANCVIKDAHIGAGTQIKPFSHIDNAKTGANSQIGPYARLRPGTELGDEVHIGNFVEVKNSQIAAKSKANHLAYIGDATIGSRVSQLVAPVRIGKGATIGAGTTLSKDAPADQLTLSRTKQTAIPGWKRPVKKPT
jgi:bifunctional UDP-N-acetylglucosamine pyrophosphorylase/glucosamine-1-phosphate N-acetyltransferase